MPVSIAQYESTDSSRRNPLLALARLLGILHVLAHLPLVALDPLLALPAAVAADARALGAVALGLGVYLDEPVVLALLVERLVSPLALPLARLLVVRQVAALLARLGRDALLGREALPLGRRLDSRHRLLARQPGRRLGQRQQHAVRRRLQRARCEELVDERLRAVAGNLRQRLL